MASWTSSPAFTPGATVSVYAPSSVPGRTYEGAAVTTAVASSSGVAVLSGLADATDYYATDGTHTVKFATPAPAASVTVDDGSITTAKLAASAVTDAKVSDVAQGKVTGLTAALAAKAAIASSVRSATWAGTVSVATGTAKMRFIDAATIVSVALDAGTGPTGAALLVDVNKNGTTVFTTQANRPQIAAGATQGTAAVPAVTAVAAGDVLTFDVDQVGSTVAGADLTVTVKVA